MTPDIGAAPVFQHSEAAEIHRPHNHQYHSSVTTTSALDGSTDSSEQAAFAAWMASEWDDGLLRDLRWLPEP